MEKFIRYLKRADRAFSLNDIEGINEFLNGASKHLPRKKSLLPNNNLAPLHYKKILKDLKESFSSIAAAKTLDLAEKGLKKKKKQARKKLQALMHLADMHWLISDENPGDIIKAILRCKSITALRRLEEGEEILGFKMPGLKDRYSQAQGRLGMPVLSNEWQRFADVCAKKREYLERKNTADKVANVLTVVLSILGIGLISAIALMLILPAMPLAAFIPTLAVFTLLGGYTESFVFKSYIQRFCRQCVRGFFKKIDDHIINRDIANEADKTIQSRRELSEGARQAILKEHKLERVAKYSFAVLSIPVAMAAGVGFTGLAFSNVLSLLPILGIGGAALTVAPWAIALAVGPLYAMVMYSMLYRAVKNNIFGKIKQHVVDLFSIKDGKTWADLTSAEQFKHVGLCALKALGVTLAFSVSVLATIFTAGAWLESSVGFFAIAFNVIEKTANLIGMGIAGSFLMGNFWFSVENSLDTAKTLMNIAWKKTGSMLLHIVQTPKKLAKALLNFIPFVIHVAGMGAVATQGAEAFVLKPVLGPDPALNKLVAGATEVLEETLVDAKEALIEPMSHHHDHDHDHSHGDLFSLGETVVKGVHGFFKTPEIEFEKFVPINLTPFKVNRDEMEVSSLNL